MLRHYLIRLSKARELRRNSCMTAAQFQAMKLQKFRHLVRYAHQRSPYYRRVIEQHGIDIDRCAPADFPALDKKSVLEHFDLIVTDRSITRERITAFVNGSHDPDELFLNRFRVIHTSGSSGEKGYVVFSRADWARGMAQITRGARGARTGSRSSGGTESAPSPSRQRRRGRLRAAYYGAVGGHFAGVTLVSAAMRSDELRCYEVNEPLARTVAQLNAFQPQLLAGYTGALIALAGKQRDGALNIAPSAVATMGEGMSAADRKTLEEAFGCVATNAYGCSEHLTMGTFMPGAATMQLYDDDLIYELFENHCLVTNLFNYTLPLIRYRMDDVIRPVASKTDPASPYLEIESLVGRSELTAKFLNDDGNEDFISPHTIAALFVPGVERFQLQVTSAVSFRFLVCLEPRLQPDARVQAIAGVNASLREILTQKRMSKVTFMVRAVTDIALNARTRKFDLIVDAGGAAAARSPREMPARTSRATSAVG